MLCVAVIKGNKKHYIQLQMLHSQYVGVFLAFNTHEKWYHLLHKTSRHQSLKPQAYGAPF
ncbi:hypothetical protein GBAR_LOCUS4930 [Geodia barretti]|uniref:Uncharacterized protein n=1 Tax=Geodia barretti TaxID=519541 RepID=A0AA35R9K6_GEOBA|nr:hypothetical protein GBAR_LOCUS4930 [Geodia barretti]